MNDINITGQDCVLKNTFRKEYFALVKKGIGHNEIKQTLESKMSDVLNSLVNDNLDNGNRYNQEEVDVLYKILYSALEIWIYKWVIE